MAPSPLEQEVYCRTIWHNLFIAEEDCLHAMFQTDILVGLDSLNNETCLRIATEDVFVKWVNDQNGTPKIHIMASPEVIDEHEGDSDAGFLIVTAIISTLLCCCCVFFSLCLMTRCFSTMPSLKNCTKSPQYPRWTRNN